MKHLNRALLSTLGLGLLGLACSSTDTPGGTGGLPGTGGAVAGTGGAVGTGGGTGAVGATGGGTGAVPGTGGATGTGSVPGTGGVVGTGSIGSTGGITGDGGAPPTGGAAGSGTGGGGGGLTPIPKPALITSAAGAFWKTDAMPTMGGTTADFTVNPAMELQDWIGWGGTFNEVGWNELMKLDAAKRDEIMKLLFSRVDGLALTWGRIPIGASDYALQRYTLCDAPCNADNLETTFSLIHDKDTSHGLIPYVKAAQAVIDAEKAQYAGVPDTKFWGSPWTPPPWMKTNNAYDKGVMKSDAATLGAYAKYFRLWVEGYEAEGIPIDHVYPQNEPGWAQGYPSCAWGHFTDGKPNTDTAPFLGSFVKDYLVPELGDKADVWFGTFSNNAHFSGKPNEGKYWESLADKSVIKGVGLQWETVASASIALGANVPVMQSEHRCGNYPWKGVQNSDGTSYSTTAGLTDPANADEESFWADYAPNNYNYGVESWKLFRQWLEAGVNGYSAWNMVLDRVGKNLDQARPWPQNALISFNQDGSVNVTPYYYVFRHLTQYAQPGGKRVNVTGDALAFKNPDGSIVVAMYNPGGAGQKTLSIGGTMMQFTMPANGWATVNYTP